ncbi:hypothetical protein [Nibribacter koreensis]|uniref:Outer membrane protein beta-barrel domain-containing protein n=1 Tax=Nibribacter koreensis TaxID=1084519 RepID=A0ABP8FNU7_9BACT
MKKLFCTYLIVGFFGVSAAGQDLGDEDKRKLIVSPGIAYQGQVFGEVNLFYADVYLGHGYGFLGPRLGLEANFRKDRFIYAPKIGFELSGMLIALRTSAVGYVDDTKLDLRILPEAGFDFFFGSLTYGYNIPVLSYKSSEVKNHKISLSARIHPAIWNELK